MRLGIVWAVVALALPGLAGLKVDVQAGEKKVKHAPLHHALYELHDARHELKATKYDFGNLKTAALVSINDAIKQLDLCLMSKGYNLKPSPTMRDLQEHHKKYKHHHHLHHAVHELHAAHKHLKEAKHDFGGHRENALRDVNHAIRDINALLASYKG